MATIINPDLPLNLELVELSGFAPPKPSRKDLFF